MKIYGKVSLYDGFTGTILGMDGHSYLLLKQEIISGEVNVNDYVSFDGEIYQDIELTKYIARFVKKISEAEYKG